MRNDFRELEETPTTMQRQKLDDNDIKSIKINELFRGEAPFEAHFFECPRARAIASKTRFSPALALFPSRWTQPKRR